MTANRTVNYVPPGPVAKAFLESEAFIRSLIGPIGSGKSVACVIDILRRARMQARGPDGLRHTRWAVVRNTYPDLKNTTLKTWLDWCPASFGKLTLTSPITHRVITDELDMDVIFLALDRDEDIRKLLSLELTGLWVNEAKFVPKSILDGATGRVGRYPSVRDGGCTWAGVNLDSNPPDTESWLYRLAEGVDTELVAETAKLAQEMRVSGLLRPNQKLMEFFRQPSGRGPDAENLPNLRKGYYQFASAGKSADYLKVYIDGEYGFVVDGKPVYPAFRDSMHTAASPIAPLPNIPILVAADFGLTPAAVFAQRTASGRWLILSEVVTEDCGITRFGELLLSHKAVNYPGHTIGSAWGDPAGNSRGPDEENVFTILNNVTGWGFHAAPSNDPELRREAVTLPLNRLVDGLPALLLSPQCMTLRKGFTGGYHFKTVASANGAYTKEEPAKNKYSHVHDALQYLALGGGEYEVALGKRPRGMSAEVRVADGVGADPFGPPAEPASSARYTNAKDMRAWVDRKAASGARIASSTEDTVY